MPEKSWHDSFTKVNANCQSLVMYVTHGISDAMKSWHDFLTKVRDGEGLGYYFGGAGYYFEGAVVFCQHHAPTDRLSPNVSKTYNLK